MRGGRFVLEMGRDQGRNENRRVQEDHPFQGVLKCPNFGLLTPGTSALLTESFRCYVIVGSECVRDAPLFVPIAIGIEEYVAGDRTESSSAQARVPGVGCNYATIDQNSARP